MRKNRILLAVLLAGVVAAGCSHAMSDDAIATDIKAKMFSDAQLKSANLTVSSKNGEVTLSGEVPSYAARYQAYKLASDTPGVVKVNDQMRVADVQAAVPPAPPEPTPAPAPVKPAPVRKPAPPEPAPVERRAEPRPVTAAAPEPAASVPMQQAAPPPPPAPREPEPIRVEIPVGTRLGVRMIDGVDSEVNKTGQTFHAALDEPVSIDGNEVIPEGAEVTVKLAEASSAGRISGRSELQLELVNLKFQGRTYSLQSSSYEQRGSSRGKRTAATVGGGAAIGAIIGGIAGGGKGAAIGATVGAGAGTAVQVMTKGEQVRIPSETRLDFTLEAPVTVVYLPKESKARR